MSENAKVGPGGGPAQVTDLAERVREGSTESEDDRELRVRLEVSGGAAGEKFELRFAATESGRLEIYLVNELRQVESRREEGELSEGEFRRLLESVNVAQMSELSRLRQPIPPCSVVGRLIVSDGQQEVRVLYMAEPEQAREAGFGVHPSIERATEAIYGLVSERLSVKEVRP